MPGASVFGVQQTDWPKWLDWHIDKSLYWVPIMTATFLAKFAVPPLGAMGISVAIPLMLATLGVGVLSGRAVIEPRAMVAFLVVIGSLVAMQSAAVRIFSLPSLLLLAALHLPYAFRMAQPPRYNRIVHFVQSVGLVLAVLGVLQYGLQFVVGASRAFPIENYFPKMFVVATFNQQAPISYGAFIYRANGMVMVEPSVFSQFLAISIVIELITRKRLWYMALAFMSMMLSYSGTGVLLLMASLVVLGIVHGKWLLLGGLVAGGGAVFAVAAIVGNVPYLSVFIARAAEFNATGSSGFARFVGGYYMFEQYLWPDPWRALVGFGAGTFKTYSVSALYPVSEMAIFKVIFEFGLVGAGLYFGFLGYCFFRSSAPFVLRAALAICLILSGNYFPFAHALAFVLLVWTDPVYRLGPTCASAPVSVPAPKAA